MIKVSDPTRPQVRGTYQALWSVEDLALAGSYAYVGRGSDGLEVIDISDPASPHRVGQWGTNDVVTGVAISGKYAYLTSHSGLAMLDISDPANPRHVAAFARSSDSMAWRCQETRLT